MNSDAHSASAPIAGGTGDRWHASLPRMIGATRQLPRSRFGVVIEVGSRTRKSQSRLPWHAGGTSVPPRRDA